MLAFRTRLEDCGERLRFQIKDQSPNHSALLRLIHSSYIGNNAPLAQIVWVTQIEISSLVLFHGLRSTSDQSKIAATKAINNPRAPVIRREAALEGVVGVT